MSDVQMLGPWLRRFFSEYTVTERNLAHNTRKSYRDTVTQFLDFLSRKMRKPRDRLAVHDVTSRRVLQFLAYLENERGCSIQTRNQRLAALRAFARFVGSREPAHVEWSGHIRATPSKKTTSQLITWLSKEEMDAMLDVPDRTTRRGRIEYALLLFLYKTGARVSEVAPLTVGDLQVGRNDGRVALVTLHGKGGKVRQCPLRPETELVLAELVDGRRATDPVFLSRYRQPYTRFGIYRLVERCAAGVPALAGRKITPHVLRHTTACHLALAGVDINTIRAWLGHATLHTTNIYVEINLEMKARAVAFCDAAQPKPGRPWKEDKGIVAFLKSL